MTAERQFDMKFLLLFLFDIVLGYIPQAAGCAVCLFAITGQRLKSKSFLITSVIFSAIAVVIRLICNYGLIDFGFHTVLIWMIFVIVAILYNKFPVLQSTISILLSGILIFLAEIVVGIILTLSIGGERFNAIMDNTATIEGQITRAMYGIPMNILFLGIVLVVYIIFKHRRSKATEKAAAAPVATAEDATEEFN